METQISDLTLVNRIDSVDSESSEGWILKTKEGLTVQIDIQPVLWAFTKSE